MSKNEELELREELNLYTRALKNYDVLSKEYWNLVYKIHFLLKSLK